MRPTAALVAVSVALAAGPALAQVQQGNPNAANQSLGNAAQMRSLQENQVTQSNTTMMNAERSAAPPPPAGGQVLGGPAPAGGVPAAGVR